mmetsp:Transcript_15841/g.22948  ORF Transcript_15841/g.22948 Transcript_15841/m.22948 type:complete len:247 (+) Transcript_15841:68-808(+)
MQDYRSQKIFLKGDNADQEFMRIYKKCRIKSLVVFGIGASITFYLDANYFKKQFGEGLNLRRALYLMACISAADMFSKFVSSTKELKDSARSTAFRYEPELLSLHPEFSLYYQQQRIPPPSAQQTPYPNNFDGFDRSKQVPPGNFSSFGSQPQSVNPSYHGAQDYKPTSDFGAPSSYRDFDTQQKDYEFGNRDFSISSQDSREFSSSFDTDRDWDRDNYYQNEFSEQDQKKPSKPRSFYPGVPKSN